MKKCCSNCLNAHEEGESPLCGRIIFCAAKKSFVTGRNVTKPNKCPNYCSSASQESEPMADEPAEDRITENQISLF